MKNAILILVTTISLFACGYVPNDLFPPNQRHTTSLAQSTSPSTSAAQGGGGAGGETSTDSQGGGSTATSTSDSGPGGADAGGQGGVAGGGGSVAPSCQHTPCSAGEGLDPNCDPIVHEICTNQGPGNAKCCTEWWSGLCTAQYYYTVAPLGGGCTLNDHTCKHSPCEVGGALPGGDNACNQFVFQICSGPAQAYCCTTGPWDAACINAVVNQCDNKCACE